MSQLQVTGEAKIRDIQGPVVANSGVITALDGAANQYVRGDGTLASFPTSGGGGSSVSYYLNGSVNQGTFGGSTYYQMSKNAIVGTGTNFSTSSDGLLAQFITDANDPDVVSIPSGNWNVEFFMNVSASSGALASFYVEIYKYDGSAFTLLATNVATPEQLTNTTTVDAYFTSVAMPLSAMALTDRLAVRIYANVASKTVTLYTEDNRLCQIVTTFSKGILSINNLTDQSQNLTTGTSGTNFNIDSSGDTHTFNLPIASASNTGKLSSTDWSTFNNKQNALTNPITGTGASGNVAYFDGTTSITAENSFNYDASTNRLGVNTTVPNATIGANAATDSGYSLLLKNDNANYNGIGFATTSTYGNVIGTEKLGTAPARNLTLLNQSGYISITEVGNLGVNILNPNAGIDIYNSTSSQLWLHTANSGISATDGVRLALFSNNGANLRNFEGAMSITSEGDFQVITLGAENIRVNSADGFVGIGNPTTLTSLLTVNGAITQSSVTSSLLKTNASGTLVAAVAGTDYVVPSALSGYVPTSRTLTINGTAYDLSADRSWSVGTTTGSGADGRVAYWNGANSITSEAGFIYDSSTNRLGVNTSVPNATIGADAALDSGYGLLIKTGASNYNGIGIAIDSTYGNTIETAKLGTASARNLTLLNQSGYVSLTESGAFGVGILSPNVGIDIYNSTQSQLWLHNAATGITATDGVRLALFNSKSANLRNFDGAFSITAEGDFQIITIGAENFRINSANGYVGIGDPASLPSMLTVNGGATITGLTTGQVLFPTSGGTLSGSSSLFWDNTNSKLGIGTSTLSSARVTITSTSEANHLQLVSNAPAMTFINAISYSYFSTVGMATASNNFVTGAVQGDLVLGAYNTSSILFYNANTNTLRMSLNGSGAAIFSGSVTARGPKSQIIVDGNSTGAGISLTNTIVGVDRRNWGIFTEQDTDGDFVIKRSTVSGGDPQSGTTTLSLSRTGAATFSSSVSTTGGTQPSGNGMHSYFSSNVSYIDSLQAGVAWRDISIGGNDVILRSGGIERMRINSSGNVGIGTSSPGNKLVISQPVSTSFGNGGTYIGLGDTENASGQNVLIGFGYRGSSTNEYPAVMGYTATNNGGNQSGALVFGTRDVTTNTAPAERMRITSGGGVAIGATAAGGTYKLRVINSSAVQGDAIFASDNNVYNSILVYAAGADGYNGAGTIAIFGRNTSTNRSINAGGTINASGADYAEYMTKAIDDTIEKGDIVGVNENGLLTNIFADAKSFVVKSTDPSYVGGDTWGNVDDIGKLPLEPTKEQIAEHNAKLEEARAKVDRIAFSGQVPCNVLNAQVGDYIIPIEIDGKINGQAVTNPTFEQYQISVGKVWKIMEDGRAWIAVKIG